ERPRPHARVYRPPRAEGGQRLGVGPGKAEALLRQGVEVGGLDLVVAVGPDVVLPQTVQYNEYDVHRWYPRMTLGNPNPRPGRRYSRAIQHFSNSALQLVRVLG